MRIASGALLLLRCRGEAIWPGPPRRGVWVARPHRMQPDV